MSEINLPPDLPVTEARTIRRALRLLEKYQRQPGEQFNSTTFTKTWLQLRLALQEREVFLVLYLDNQNRLLECETLFTGTINHTEVHLVGAYPVTPINIAIELPEFDPSVYNDAIRGQHLLAMKALRQKFSIDENMTHVEKGLPEEVIPDLAEHLQAGIVVLGTIGRTGISAAFLGNTAEQVIDHLRCDLLVIKPDQYQTPVELDDEEDD